MYEVLGVDACLYSSYVIESGVFYHLYYNRFVIDSLSCNEWEYIVVEFYSFRVWGIIVFGV